MSQGKKTLGKVKNMKPVDKGKKCVVISTPSPVMSTSTGPSSNIRNKLRDKAKGNCCIDSRTDRRTTID